MTLVNKMSSIRNYEREKKKAEVRVDWAGCLRIKLTLWHTLRMLDEVLHCAAAASFFFFFGNTLIMSVHVYAVPEMFSLSAMRD